MARQEMVDLLLTLVCCKSQRSLYCKFKGPRGLFRLSSIHPQEASKWRLVFNSARSGVEWSAVHRKWWIIIKTPSRFQYYIHKKQTSKQTRDFLLLHIQSSTIGHCFGEITNRHTRQCADTRQLSPLPSFISSPGEPSCGKTFTRSNRNSFGSSSSSISGTTC